MTNYRLTNVPYKGEASSTRIVGVILKPGDEGYGALGLSEPLTWLEKKLSENDELRKENEKLKLELWNTGLTLGVIARWPRTHFNRNYVEEWVIRTARILRQFGDPNWKDPLTVNGGKSIRNSRLDKVKFDDKV